MVEYFPKLIKATKLCYDSFLLVFLGRKRFRRPPAGDLRSWWLCFVSIPLFVVAKRHKFFIGHLLLFTKHNLSKILIFLDLDDLLSS